MSRDQIEKFKGKYDADGFYLLKNGGFYDTSGYFYDKNGFDAVGGFYNEKGYYESPKTAFVHIDKTKPL